MLGCLSGTCEQCCTMGTPYSDCWHQWLQHCIGQPKHIPQHPDNWETGLATTTGLTYYAKYYIHCVPARYRYRTGIDMTGNITGDITGNMLSRFHQILSMIHTTNLYSPHPPMTQVTLYFYWALSSDWQNLECCDCLDWGGVKSEETQLLCEKQ